MPTTAFPRHILSKSTFMRGCQCSKSLWLHKHAPGSRDVMSDAQANIFSMGTNVGEIARGLFPGGIDASPEDAFHYQQSVADTRRYILAGHQVIYEAAFQYEGILAAIDILVKKNNKWYAFEVKSSTQVKEPFIQDAALQYYVITNAGITLEDIFIVHINNEYVRKGALNLTRLFRKSSVKKEVLVLQDFMATKTTELKTVVGQKEMPEIPTGDHCLKPYPCDFMGFCGGFDSAEELSGEEIINKAELKNFLKQLKLPVYYMDFETFMLAVPEYDGHWPYRQVPFQYSVHRQSRSGNKMEHLYFLADNDCDPCPEFVKKLVNDLGERGSIVVYNKSFENSRLSELKEDYPEFAERITNIQSRMVDLMVPFRRKYFYLPAMQGSYSIKRVLPAVLPELSYDGLTISNGGDASASFYNLRYTNDQSTVESTRNALLEYCKLDTWAMVKLVERMKEIISGS